MLTLFNENTGFPLNSRMHTFFFFFLTVIQIMPRHMVAKSSQTYFITGSNIRFSIRKTHGNVLIHSAQDRGNL